MRAHQLVAASDYFSHHDHRAICAEGGFAALEDGLAVRQLHAAQLC